jgi:hypothetical protein
MKAPAESNRDSITHTYKNNVVVVCVCMLKERLILISESINNITHAQIALYNTSFVFISVRLSMVDLIRGRETNFC